MQFEMLASGDGLIEAPHVDDHGRRYFSKVPNGGVYRHDPDGRIESVIPKRRHRVHDVNQGGVLVSTGRSLILFTRRAARAAIFLPNGKTRR
jgi:sugar lactone lactonase YvrE